MNAIIYQTLEDRGNYDEIERHGPYYCSQYEEDGSVKVGIRFPWLGEGYYFWDSRKSDAQWWGETIYWTKCKGYVICRTTYDQHSLFLFDMVGNMSHIDEFEKCALLIQKEENKTRVSFPYVLAWMKRSDGFNYKAIRVWPDFRSGKGNIFFPGNKAKLTIFNRVQICFFDRTLLKDSFKLCEKRPFPADFTI